MEKLRRHCRQTKGRDNLHLFDSLESGLRVITSTQAAKTPDSRAHQTGVLMKRYVLTALDMCQLNIKKITDVAHPKRR